ncbi:MAG TPA: VanZ family protein [Bellilinea sp.]|nr:VanZ family protein [Bellilinea sp.]
MFSVNSEIIFFVSLAAWVGYRLLANKKAGVFWAREVVINLFYFYGWAVFLLTLAPLNIVLFDFDFSGANLVPLSEALRYLRYLDAPGVKRNLLGNLFLLAPLGIFLPVLHRRYRRLGAVLGTGFLVTLGIEAAQLLLAYRVFDIDDLILNVLGVFLAFVIFSLLLVIPGLRRAVDRITNRPQVGTSGYFKGYVVVVILLFGAVFTAGYLENAHTTEQILDSLPSQGQRLVAKANYGRYLILLTESGDGGMNLVEYRQVPIKRFAPVYGYSGLTLQQDEFVVSGNWLVGEYSDFFVVARSNQLVAAMQVGDEQYPVLSDGEYHFSVGRFPIATDIRFREFRFIDAAGNDLGLTSADQN